MARVSTIPAGVPFVDTLAAGLLAEADGDMLALADMLVLLPNRRACRSLRDAFWRAGKGRALALPAIQPIGDLDPDDLLIDAEAELDLPPVIGGLRRRLLLTRLLMRAKALDLTADQAGRLAEDLSDLLDELQTERVPLDALEDLVPEAFATHWQRSLDILRIIGRFWPAVLAEEGALDPAERRHRVLAALAERWVAAPPARRIIAAGSTGSIPATRSLLRTIASLPRGEVVLPGLDSGMDEASWQAMCPQHPQRGLKDLLSALDVERHQVERWHAVDAIDGTSDARTALLRDVMQPSGLGGGWQAALVEPQALDGLTLAEHPDVATEATAIALRLRAALLDAERTAALITPDRSLARRVVVELRRFGIAIDDSAGISLDRTVPGSFLLLAARLVLDEVRPVALLAVLKHPLMRAGLEADVVRRRARALDRLCLRGPAILGGFRQIIGELNDLRQAAGDDRPELQNELLELRDWIEALAGLAKPFADLAAGDAVPLGDLAAAHLRFVEALAAVDGSAEALWAKEAGEAAAGLFRELLDAADPEDVLPPAAYPPLLAGLMTRQPVRPKRPAHPRLTIYGQLEARLQQTDLVILAGLNEGTWPRATEPGPWLNPSMRGSLGLPPLERRIGQAAHDFVQASAGGEVVLSRAEKDLAGSPTVPSRWLVRLKALLDGQLAEGWERIGEKPDWQQWASKPRFPDRSTAAGGTTKTETTCRDATAKTVGERCRALDEGCLRALRQAHFGVEAARCPGGRSGGGRPRHHHPRSVGTLCPRLSRRLAERRPRTASGMRAKSVCPFQSAPAGASPLVAALSRSGRLGAGDRGSPPGHDRQDSGGGEGRTGDRGPRGTVSPDRTRRSAGAAHRRRPGDRRLQDRQAAGQVGDGARPSTPVAIGRSDCRSRRFRDGLDTDPVKPELAELEFWQLAGGEEGGKLERRSLELVEAALEGLAGAGSPLRSGNHPLSRRLPAADREPAR